MFNTSPAKMLMRQRILTLALSVLGIALSGYSVYVQYRKGTDKDYKAFCDISDEVSCSKVFNSRYGNGFGFLGALLGEDSPLIVSNGIYGIIFYSLVIILGEFSSFTAAKIQQIFVILTNLMSVYLAYILFFVLKDKCVVCISTYVINFLLAVSCFVRVRYLNALKSKKKGTKKGASNATKAESNKNKSEPNKKAESNKANANATTVTKGKSNKKAESAKDTPNSAKHTPSSKKGTPSTKKDAQSSKKNVESNNVANSKKNAANSKKNNANANKSPVNSKKNSSNENKGSSNKNTNKNTGNASKHSKKKN